MTKSDAWSQCMLKVSYNGASVPARIFEVLVADICVQLQNFILHFLKQTFIIYSVIKNIILIHQTKETELMFLT
jgi:hypothetical protein